MFGYVMANLPELNQEQKRRYSAVYCGVCRGIRTDASNAARLGLSYDMAFLALLLMSLYEPEETAGKPACLLHPLRSYIDNEYVRYAADMNVALAYYNCLDDVADEGKPLAKMMSGLLGKALPEIENRYSRQCGAIRECIARLSALEQEIIALAGREFNLNSPRQLGEILFEEMGLPFWVSAVLCQRSDVLWELLYMQVIF